jgi:hypothetical protein
MPNIRSYGDCARLASTKKRKIDNNTYLSVQVTIDQETVYHIKLHSTHIITYFPNGEVELNSGGWRTSTTKNRMNEYAPVGISQYRGLWTVRYDGKDYPYADGMVINTSTGEVRGILDVDPKAEVKLRKRVNEYVKGYMQAFAAGEVPPPSQGDCWGCYFLNSKTGEEILGNDHLLRHIEEKYYVPSLLQNALGDWAGQCTSLAAKGYVGSMWEEGERNRLAPYLGSVAIPQLQKVLFDYMAHRLGLTPGRTTYSRAA